MRHKLFLLAAPLLFAALPATAQQAGPDMAAADVVDRDGNQLGSVSVATQPSGHALVTIALNGLPSGTHAVHLHETGDCSADDFSSAGGHIAGDAQHGIGVEGGPHPGDLPNVTVGDDGVVNIEFFNAQIDVARDLLDGDGAAFVVHAGADDYKSQPAGDAGDRIACGEFTAQSGE